MFYVKSCRFRSDPEPGKASIHEKNDDTDIGHSTCASVRLFPSSPGCTTHHVHPGNANAGSCVHGSLLRPCGNLCACDTASNAAPY